jgi:hypothetical protein
MFHLKPLLVSVVGIGVTLFTLLPFQEKPKSICYDCNIDFIKKHNDSLKQVNTVLFSKVKDTLQIGKLAIKEVEELKEEVKDLKQDLVKKPEVIHDTIHDTLYYAKGFLGKYKVIEKSQLFKIEDTKIDTIN